MHPISYDPSWTADLARLVATCQATGSQGTPLELEQAFRTAGSLILDTRQRGGKAMVVGNGGSAAIAAHLQTDLAHSLKVRALVFTEPSLVTAQANDFGYENAFANLADLWTDPGDLLVAISSSGKSPNILNACARARALGAKVLTYSGFQPDNALRSLGDLNFHVASGRYGLVESAHALLVHQLTDLVLEALSGKAGS